VKIAEPQSDNKALTQFRQQVYALMEKQADVLFELTDAVIQTPHPSSFTALTLAPAVTRRWSSLSDALSTGRLDEAGLRQLCLAHLPAGRTRYHFALDVMSVRRMHSPTLNERVYCHGAQREVGGKGIVVGLPYSLLAFVDQRGSSWAPTVHTQRVKPGASAVAVALTQTSWLAQHLPPALTAETALDGGYGNLPFFLGVQGQRLFATARLRNDRVFYQIPSPPPAGTKPRGRPVKYGKVFKCSDPSTWPPPDETLELEDASYGRVRLQLWSALRLRVKDHLVDLTVVRSRIHTEQVKPPAAHWYGVYNGTAEPTTLARAFECITHRWPIEPANRFRKERLHAELPKVRQAAASDLWMQLLQVIEWELYLYRGQARDVRLPWQAPLTTAQLTPGRVIRALSEHLPQVGTPTQKLLPRGKSPGWKKGRPRSRPERYRLTPKRRKQALAASRAA
jgi:hypothetical protein